MRYPSQMSEAPLVSPTGLLVIDKHVGPTSMQICAWIRSRLRRGEAPKRVKVGHGGTLDPLASGVLVIMVGKATSLCSVVMAGEKEYVADVDLSAFSTTDDAEGERTMVEIARVPAREDVEQAVRGFVGEIQQAPPAFSAININGQRAYDLARAGKVVELAARPVVVHEIRVMEFAFPRLVILVRCGKGTYIRSLARDLGKALGTGGMLTGLRRTRVGRWSIDQAVDVNGLPTSMGQADLLSLPV